MQKNWIASSNRSGLVLFCDHCVILVSEKKLIVSSSCIFVRTCCLDVFGLPCLDEYVGRPMVAAASWTTLFLRVEREKQTGEWGRSFQAGRGPGLWWALSRKRGSRAPAVALHSRATAAFLRPGQKRKVYSIGFPNMECACSLLNACTAVH
jgi:hypothetical protein